MADLLKDGQGRCQAWCEFLIAVLAVDGVGASMVGLANTSPPPNALRPAGEEWIGNDGFIEMKAGPAQGTGTANYAKVQFTNHAVVRLASSNIVMDPSYGSAIISGTTWEDTCKAWEDAYLANLFWYAWVKDNPGTMHEVFKPQTVDKDLQWN